MSQRLGVVLHKNPPRLRWIYDLNWFRDRDCTHTHTHTHILSVRTIFLCNGGESCATPFNTAPRQGGRERGKWRHVARSIFRVQVYLENFISRVTWRLFRRRVRTDTASSSRYTAAPCNSVSEIRNSRQPGGNPPRGVGKMAKKLGIEVGFFSFFSFFSSPSSAFSGFTGGRWKTWERRESFWLLVEPRIPRVSPPSPLETLTEEPPTGSVGHR